MICRISDMQPLWKDCLTSEGIEKHYFIRTSKKKNKSKARSHSLVASRRPDSGLFLYWRVTPHLKSRIFLLIFFPWMYPVPQSVSTDVLPASVPCRMGAWEGSGTSKKKIRKQIDSLFLHVLHFFSFNSCIYWVESILWLEVCSWRPTWVFSVHSGIQRLNSGHLSWWTVLLSAESPCQDTSWLSAASSPWIISTPESQYNKASQCEDVVSSKLNKKINAVQNFEIHFAIPELWEFSCWSFRSLYLWSLRASLIKWIIAWAFVFTIAITYF